MWIAKTGQLWKIILFLILAFADLCFLGMLIWRVNHRTSASTVVPNEVVLSLSFVGLGIITFGWLWLSIRCTDCKASVAGYVLKHIPASSWFTTLLTLTRCPSCGSLGKSHLSH